MTEAGAQLGTAPTACPFVAYQDDRDRRSDQPDARHRCYAEQVPAPRTIAHQERFCLSPSFAACPVFQAWAVRAAAQPAAGADLTEPGTPIVAAPHAWPDSMDAALPPAAGLAAATAPEPESTRQLSAFGAAEDAPEQDGAASDANATSEAIEAPKAEAALDEGEVAAVPAFLAGRSPRPAPPPQTEPVNDNVVPSWDVERLRVAERAGDPGGESAFSRLLTVIAVVIILALGIAAVLIVPGLLGGGAGQSARPSLVAAPSHAASPLASSVAILPTPTPAASDVTPTETVPVPEATPTPTPPATYKVQAGDTLARIARQFGVSVEQLLVANPSLTNADHIQIGQRLVIPPPATAAP